MTAPAAASYRPSRCRWSRVAVPSESTDRTPKVCDPSVSAGRDGLVQAEKPPPSRLHWKLTVLSLSEKASEGCAVLLGSDGLVSMVGAADGVVFTVHV